MSGPDFSEYLRQFLEEVYPDYDPGQLFGDHQEIILRLEAIYQDLENIHIRRIRYDLHWALHEAGIIHRELVEEMELTINKVLASCFEGRNREELDHIEKHLRDVDRKRSWAILHNEKYFSTLSNLVSLVDIAISVLLIILISEIAHIGGNIIHSIFLGILFLAIIAVLKVSLDRFWILPSVTRWGWDAYHRSITVSKKTMVKLMGISMVIGAAVDRHDDLDTVVRLIEKGIRRI
ncbi:MAG: hypothetical protein RQ758_03835 [Methanomicrobiaceae archaeon]|nr:hypothetical protein [Methanomicrobiaceae archaeon]